MRTRFLLILSLVSSVAVIGACSPPRPRDGGTKAAPLGETAASGRRKVIDLDELAILGGAAKDEPKADDAKATSTGLTRESIRAVIRAYQAPLRACYTQGLARDPSLAGTVVLRFDVDTGGVVQGLGVSRSTLASREVEQCVVQLLARIPFPRPAVRTTVTYPLTFRSAP